jgi:uncharacterized protein (DUF1800 family)
VSATDAVTALRRFGLGARPGEPWRIVSDPREHVVSQLDAGRAPEIGGLPTSAQLWQEVMRYRRARRQKDDASQDDPSQDDASQDGGMEGAMGNAMESPAEPMKPAALTRDEMTARFDHATTTDSPLLERLVGFWSNHFTVSMQGAVLRAIAGAYERETIRPHVLGRFRDMLHAVVRHPAMLFYLDNHRSIGPNSRVGQRRGRGLNENLAREILELHTVGVNGGYSQDDVMNFARALTGWTVDNSDGEAQGTFMFKPQWHEPGAVTVMGRTYPEGGVEQAEAVLDDLAAHPATARHVARKLAVHFVSEKAPLSLVERLEGAFRDGDGDLDAVTRMLVSSDDAWRAEPRKILPPYDFVIAVSRALDHRPRSRVLADALRTFGQVVWRAPSPAGWPDEDEAWASPHALVERLDWVKQVTAGASGSIAEDVRDYADDLFGGTLSDFTRQAIARSETREQALALLFMSPEFQRR